MSELGEYFHDMKKFRQSQRAKNRLGSTNMLQAAGITFESKHDGAHLIIQAGTDMIDFWPGTGLWIVRGGRLRDRGVKKLINYIKQRGQHVKT